MTATLSPTSTATGNVAHLLVETARRTPGDLSVLVQTGKTSDGTWRYRPYSFQQLDQESDRIASGLWAMGVKPGTRLALLVRPGFEFISLVFGLFKSGAVQILVDPGLGRKNLVDCLAAAEPEGFVAIPPAHAVRVLLQKQFPRARFNVTVGRRWFWGGPTLDRFRRRPWPGTQMIEASADDPAAIIFTSGSTGPPKGVLYRHGNFIEQALQIRDQYGIAPGGRDLSCFPLFALFNAAMGVTTVIPKMDASRPASADPASLLAALRDCGCDQAFASPAVWDNVGRYCREHHQRLPGLKRILTAGAPAPLPVLENMLACTGPEAQMHTPYGATEALPVATISAAEVLSETAAASREGAGTCVGNRFSGIEWKVIRMVDGPVPDLQSAEEMPRGTVGELIVRGPVVTREYVTRTEINALAKIRDGSDVWHRMGDVGYLDPRDRFWFCGRLSQRVQTSAGTLLTIPCEAVFNNHHSVRRCALVGVSLAGAQRPLIVVEPEPGKMPATPAARQQFLHELRDLAAANWRTSEIHDFLFHPSLPVDVRHNSKIFREELADWASHELRRASGAAR